MKKILIIKNLVILVFLGHLVSNLIYLLPNNYLKKYVGSLIHNYMGTFFYQNWHLFSPNPGVSYHRIWLKCEDNNGEQSNWFDPLESIHKKHEKYRIFHYGKLLYYYRDVIENGKYEIFSDKSDNIISAKNNKSSAINKLSLLLENFCKINNKNRILSKIHFKTAKIDPFPISKRNEMTKKSFYNIAVSENKTLVF